MLYGNDKREAAIVTLVSNNIVFGEFVDFFLGPLLGIGSTRMVFANAQDKTTVIKIDIGDRNSNAIEYDTWRRIEYVTAINKWFCPIDKISPCGRIMIQKKCKPALISKLPKVLPVFFTDLHISNFGYYKGRFVAFDYELNLLMEQGMVTRTKKVTWNCR